MHTFRLLLQRARTFIKKFFREESFANRVLRKARNLFRASTSGTHARTDFRFPIKPPFVYRLYTHIHRGIAYTAPRFRAKSDSQRRWEKHLTKLTIIVFSSDRITLRLRDHPRAALTNKRIYLAHSKDDNVFLPRIILVRFRNIWRYYVPSVSASPLHRDESMRIYVHGQSQDLFNRLMTSFSQ